MKTVSKGQTEIDTLNEKLENHNLLLETLADFHAKIESYKQRLEALGEEISDDDSSYESETESETEDDTE